MGLSREAIMSMYPHMRNHKWRREYLNDGEQEKMKEMSPEELLKYINEELIFGCNNKYLVSAMLSNKEYDFRTLFIRDLHESTLIQILKGIYLGFDMHKYYDEKYIYDSDQIKQIVEGMQAGVDVSIYDSNKYCDEMMKFAKDALIHNDKELLRMFKNGYKKEFIREEWNIRINGWKRPEPSTSPITKPRSCSIDDNYSFDVFLDGLIWAMDVID